MNSLEKFLDGTKKLDNFLLKYKIQLEADNEFADFFLKSMTSNLYTKFEVYLKERMENISKVISNKKLPMYIINNELSLEMINAEISKLRRDETNLQRLLTKNGIIENLNSMVNEHIFIINLENEILSIPHKPHELEKKLCKILNIDNVLSNINIVNFENIDLIEIKTSLNALDFLKNFTFHFRHPIVHEDITIIETTDVPTSINLVREQIINFNLIVTELNEGINKAIKKYEMLIEEYSVKNGKKGIEKEKSNEYVVK